MNKPILIIITGSNGSGKTTIAEQCSNVAMNLLYGQTNNNVFTT
ncbi:hypothetical protein SPONL_102 [uncultured Candidatus Thioglobus sp.]|nr:hypothetical protein SPONL_102 [uncultured Candidatus Thioglobus sp.]